MINIWRTSAVTEEGRPVSRLVRAVDAESQSYDGALGTMKRYWALDYHWQFTNDDTNWCPTPYTQRTDNGVIYY